MPPRDDTQASAEAAVDPVPRAEVPADPGQEPGRARVKRMAGKLGSVEGADAVGAARHLPRRLVAEIGHHRNARSVAAKRVVEIVISGQLDHPSLNTRAVQGNRKGRIWTGNCGQESSSEDCSSRCFDRSDRGIGCGFQPDGDEEANAKLFAEGMIQFSTLVKDVKDLNSYWKANQGQLDKLKVSHPDLYENVRNTFANIKAKFSKEQA